MPLLTPDGKPYQASGSLNQYDPNNPQHALFNLWDEDAIRQGGSPIFYYELFIPTGEIDTDYWEARGALFSPVGTEIWAAYDPQASQNYMNMFGMDSPVEVIFELNAKAVIKAIGHMPKIGSRIETPHLGENWEIVQRNLGEFKMWGALRVQLICRKFQETTTRQNGRVTETSAGLPRALS